MDERSFKITQNAEILHMYAVQKAAILQKIKNTFLFPYLLNMQYLVGTLENVKVTEDPIELLAPYLNTLEGVNRTLKVNFNRENLIDWEVFKHTVYFTKEQIITSSELPYFEEEQNTKANELQIYLLLKLAGNNLDFIIFGIIDNKILKQDKIIYFLDNDPKVLETKKELQI